MTPLSSGHDRWSGNPEVDHVGLVARALAAEPREPRRPLGESPLGTPAQLALAMTLVAVEVVAFAVAMIALA